jgi:hypothetical protein
MWWLLLVAIALVPRSARAQTPPSASPAAPTEPRLTVGAELFAGYTYTIAPKASDRVDQIFSPSAFTLSRALVDVAGTVTPAISFRIAPDVVLETDSASSRYGDYLVRLRYGYANVQLDRWTGSWRDTWTRLGLQPTPFVEHQESIYRYRFQGTVFAERTTALAPTDTGIAFHTGVPGGFGDVHVGVYNGRGFTDTQVSGTKSFQVRGTARPFPSAGAMLRGLAVTVFHDRDRYLAGAPRTRTMVSGTYEHARFNAGADYLSQLDRTQPLAQGQEREGWSAWVTPFLNRKGRGLEGLLRFDSYGRRSAAEVQHLLIAGIAYWVSPPAGASAAAVLVDFEQQTFPDFPVTPATQRQRRLSVHAMVKF